MISFKVGKRKASVAFSRDWYLLGGSHRKVTTCILQLSHPTRVAIGGAVWNPEDDESSTTGKSIAFKRAVANLVLQEQNNWRGWLTSNGKPDKHLSRIQLQLVVHQYYSAYRTALWVEEHADDECTCTPELPDGRQNVCKKCVVQARAMAIANGETI